MDDDDDEIGAKLDEDDDANHTPLRNLRKADNFD